MLSCACSAYPRSTDDMALPTESATVAVAAAATALTIAAAAAPSAFEMNVAAIEHPERLPHCFVQCKSLVLSLLSLCGEPVPAEGVTAGTPLFGTIDWLCHLIHPPNGPIHVGVLERAIRDVIRTYREPLGGNVQITATVFFHPTRSSRADQSIVHATNLQLQSRYLARRDVRMSYIPDGPIGDTAGWIEWEDIASRRDHLMDAQFWSSMQRRKEALAADALATGKQPWQCAKCLYIANMPASNTCVTCKHARA